jgi:hypothetical protein
VPWFTINLCTTLDVTPYMRTSPKRQLAIPNCRVIVQNKLTRHHLQHSLLIARTR